MTKALTKAPRYEWFQGRPPIDYSKKIEFYVNEEGEWHAEVLINDGFVNIQNPEITKLATDLYKRGEKYKDV